MLYLRSFHRFILIFVAILGISITGLANAALVYNFNQVSGSVAAGGLIEFGGQIEISSPLAAWSASEPGAFDKFIVDIPGIGLPNIDLLVDDYLGFGQVAPTEVVSDIFSIDGSGIDGGEFDTNPHLLQPTPSDFTVYFLTFSDEPGKDSILHAGGFANISTQAFGDWELAIVPVPGAVWLFGTGILGLIGFSKRRKAA